jgi:hypothetical protein
VTRARPGRLRGQRDDRLDIRYEGIRILANPPQAPRANAICEMIIGTLRRELSGWLPIVNEHHLRQVLTEYLQHYNTARPRRSLGQRTPAPGKPLYGVTHCSHGPEGARLGLRVSRVLAVPCNPAGTRAEPGVFPARRERGAALLTGPGIRHQPNVRHAECARKHGAKPQRLRSPVLCAISRFSLAVPGDSRQVLVPAPVRAVETSP